MTQCTKKYDFKIYVENEFNIVEIKESLGKLKILYDNKDLFSSEEQIKVIELKLSNEGETIIQPYYEVNQDFGIQFINSKILIVEKIDDNSHYLKKNILKVNSPDSIILDQYNSGFLPLQKVIFEKNKFITLKIFLLQSARIYETNLYVVGKIANIDQIEIVKSEKKDGQGKSIIELIKEYGFQAFEIYLLLFISLFIMVAITVIGEKYLKKKKVLEFRKTVELIDDEKWIIINYYLRKRNTEVLINLIETLYSEGLAIDLKKYISENCCKKINLVRIYKGFGLIELLFKDKIINLPRELFVVKDGIISFNENNKEFIINFFKFVGVIKDLKPNKISENE